MTYPKTSGNYSLGLASLTHTDYAPRSLICRVQCTMSSFQTWNFGTSGYPKKKLKPYTVHFISARKKTTCYCFIKSTIYTMLNKLYQIRQFSYFCEFPKIGLIFGQEYSNSQIYEMVNLFQYLIVKNEFVFNDFGGHVSCRFYGMTSGNDTDSLIFFIQKTGFDTSLLHANFLLRRKFAWSLKAFFLWGGDGE